ncbi:nitrogenase component 1 [Sharpea azabuensis]|uniref:nitrogenase component 1 n=2 Tax=Sharpea TaxID=519427 RepID=UPI003D056AC1
MKGLRKYLTPFAPDQSGAVSVLYELGGLTVIIDAGGCTGNVCGFDEPRWFDKRSAIFSAGLRDMDAILGRDDALIQKIVDISDAFDANFIALVGTPVPAVIATDYQGICHILEKKIHKPVIYVPTTGVGLYDEGMEMAYLALFEKFANNKPTSHTEAILGVTPLDFTHAFSLPTFNNFEDFGCVGSLKKLYVASPAALKAAKRLHNRYGIDYEVRIPGLSLDMHDIHHILFIGQQVIGHTLRQQLSIPFDIASFFMMKPTLREKGDVHLIEEDDLIELVKKNDYDMIIGDPIFKDMLQDYQGQYLELIHFAVSGRRDFS